MPDATDYRKYYGFDYTGIPPEIRDRETNPMFAYNDMDDDARRRLTIQRKLPNNVGGAKPVPFPRSLRFVQEKRRFADNVPGTDQFKLCGNSYPEAAGRLG